MPVLFDRTCILCGRVLPAEKHSAALCPDCAREVRTEYRYHGEFSVPGADGAAAALCYRGAVKEALHRFKFGGRPQYAAWFAAEMAAVLAAQLDRYHAAGVRYILPIHLKNCVYGGAAFAEAAALPADPDRQFYLGTAAGLVPYGENLVVCAGGWAFKFVPLFGQACIELAVDGRSEHALERFALTADAVMGVESR